MRIIASVDPGNLCGVATLDLDDRSHTSDEWLPMRTVSEIERLAEAGVLAVIVCESFRPQPGAYTWQPEALYTIGALRYVAAKYNIPIQLQDPPPKQRQKSLLGRLIEIGWRKRTKDDHADMASMHLLIFVEKRGLV